MLIRAADTLLKLRFVSSMYGTLPYSSDYTYYTTEHNNIEGRYVKQHGDPDRSSCRVTATSLAYGVYCTCLTRRFVQQHRCPEVVQALATATDHIIIALKCVQLNCAA